MNAAITMNGILVVFGSIVAIVAGITAIIAVIKWINAIHDRCQKWDQYGTDIEQIRSEQKIITSSMLGVLDGLMQLKCNGDCAKAHADLQAYINDQAHK